MDAKDIIERKTPVVVRTTIDDTGDARRIGHRGKIVGADMQLVGLDDDPLWVVEFADRQKGDYWGEELDLASDDIIAHALVATGGAR